MKLLEIIREARNHLQENGRVSLRVLRRQFELNDEALDELIEELVDVQRVARREENVLVWVEGAAASAGVASVAPDARPEILHPQTPRRQDPAIQVRPRRRTQAGHRPVRRRERLDGAGRAARSKVLPSVVSAK